MAWVGMLTLLVNDYNRFAGRSEHRISLHWATHARALFMHSELKHIGHTCDVLSMLWTFIR